jgi:hypothetical protein
MWWHKYLILSMLFVAKYIFSINKNWWVVEQPLAGIMSENRSRCNWFYFITTNMMTWHISMFVCVFELVYIIWLYCPLIRIGELSSTDWNVSCRRWLPNSCKVTIFGIPIQFCKSQNWTMSLIVLKLVWFLMIEQYRYVVPKNWYKHKTNYQIQIHNEL